MAQAYTAPDWASGEGISASNLQSISNTLEGIVQGTDRAIHNVDINGSNLIVTYVDGTIENFAISGLKGISNVSKSSSGAVDTYTITYTDGSTYSFNVTNGGTLVVANPEMSGDEAAISSIQIGDEKYKIEGGGGGDASMVILSKAEYDALPDSKLTDGKQYFVEDWQQGGGSGGIHYSTEETLTGNKWIDGKDIYTKVINLESDSGFSGSVDIFSKITGNYCVLKSITCYRANGISYQLPYLQGATNEHIESLQTGAKFYINIGSAYAQDYTIKKIIAIVEYTK